MPDTRPSTILIVDDDHGLTRLIERSLRRSGYHCLTALTGEQALERLAVNNVDLLLLDLKLPDIGGKELLGRLGALPHTVPFIVITGQGDERVAVEMMKVGALDYLIKDSQFLDFLPLVVQRTLEQIHRDRRLQKAESALRREHAFTLAVMKAASALMVVTDPEGRIVSVNPACERLTGLSFGVLRGQDFAALFLSGPAVSPSQAFPGHRETSGPVQQEEAYFTSPAGARRLIAWSTTPLRNDQGALEYYIASGMDITERRRLEQEILEVSDREQKRIGQDLHDGLCQMLAGIDMLAVVLKNKLSDQELPEAADADIISGYVRNAIVQARLVSRGLSPVELETHGLMAALEELAAATEKLFKVGCKFECPVPVHIRDNAAAIHLYRIAQEAISNAIRHGKAGHILINLRENESHGILTIQDDGCGLPVKRDEMAPVKGRGMGLRTMNYRAAILGADLTLQPGKECGTVVRCQFPSNRS